MPGTENRLDELVKDLGADPTRIERMIFGLDALDARPRPSGFPDSVPVTDRVAVLIDAYRESKSAASTAGYDAPDPISAGMLSHTAAMRRDRIAVELAEALLAATGTP